MTEEDHTKHRTIIVEPAPLDAISRVRFSEDGNTILVSTWAGTLSLYNTTTGQLRNEVKGSSYALLDACWVNKCDAVAAGCLDGRVLYSDITPAGSEPLKEIGKHDAAVRCMLTSDESSSSCIVSGGWDSFVKVWDIKQSSSTPVTEVNVGGKVYGMCNCGENSIVMITSSRRVRIMDLRKPSSWVHDNSPPALQYQLRGISASKDGLQYVVGSTEGRAAVEWLDDSKREAFSFKCHRVDGIAYPVNTIVHNEKYNSFATGGGDGYVSFWDGEARKRIAQYPRYPTSIASLDFDPESQRIAVAVSYTFEEGEKDHPPAEVQIQHVDDSHISTKTAQGVVNGSS